MNMRPLFLLTASCASAQLYGDWTLAGQMSCATTQTETLPADAYLVLYVAAGAELSFSFLLSGGSCTQVKVLPLTSCIMLDSASKGNDPALEQYSCDACPSACAADTFTLSEAGCVLVMNEGDGSSDPPDETVIYTIGCDDDMTGSASFQDTFDADDGAAVGDLIAVNASDVVDAYDIQRDWWHSGADAGDSSSSKKSSSDGFFSLGMILAVVAGVIILICVGVGAFAYNAYENAKNLGETTVRRERPRGAHAHHMPEEEAAALEMAGRPGAAYASGAGSSCVGASSSSSPKADVAVDELELRLPTLAPKSNAPTSPSRAEKPQSALLAAADADDDDDDFARQPSYSRSSPSKAGALVSAAQAALPDSGWHWIAADGTQTGPADLAALAAAWARRDVGGATLAYNARVGPDWTAVADLDRLHARLKRASPGGGALEDIAL